MNHKEQIRSQKETMRQVFNDIIEDWDDTAILALSHRAGTRIRSCLIGSPQDLGSFFYAMKKESPETFKAYHFALTSVEGFDDFQTAKKMNKDAFSFESNEDTDFDFDKNMKKVFMGKTNNKEKEIDELLDGLGDKVDQDPRSIQNFKDFSIGILAKGEMDIPDSLRNAKNGYEFKEGLKDVKKLMLKKSKSEKDTIMEMLIMLIDRSPKHFMKCQHIMIEMFADKDLPTPMVLRDAATGKELFKAMEETKHLLMRS